MKNISLAFYMLAFGAIINSCNDPFPLGSELLEEDQVDVLFTDDIQMIASTIKEDSILAYDPDPSVTYDNFLVGDFTDPVFGNVIASAYAQLTLDFDAPDYTDAVIDSVILKLQYDSSGTYGILDQDEFSIEVYRIQEVIDIESKYYSDQEFNIGTMPIGAFTNFIPQLASSDSIKGVFDYTFDADGDTIDTPAGLRIPIDLSIGNEFITYDSITNANNSNFIEQFNGIYVKALTNTPGMLSFNLGPNSNSGLTVYYKRDGVKEQYSYEFSSRFVQSNNLKHNTTGTIVEDAFDDTTFGDSLLFVQAMSGPSVRIELPDTESFEGAIINKAELTFTVAEIPEDDVANYPPSQNLIAADIGNEGTFIFVSDIILSASSFGGRISDEVINGENVQQYTMNISSHFQDIVDGVLDNSLFLRAFPKQEKSSRSIIYGPGHSTYPMKLSLTYTKLN